MIAFPDTFLSRRGQLVVSDMESRNISLALNNIFLTEYGGNSAEVLAVLNVFPIFIVSETEILYLSSVLDILVNSPGLGSEQ